jgi:prephenate dehydrogenase
MGLAAPPLAAMISSTNKGSHPMTSSSIFYHEYYSNGVVYKTEEKDTEEKFEALLELVTSLQDRIEELEAAQLSD